MVSISRKRAGQKCPWLAAGLLLIWVGCTTSSPAPQPAPKAPESRAPAPERLTASRIREAVAPWMGTPHRMGGNDRSGIDCSGFVVRIYRDLFDVDLPRTTQLLIREGRPVDFFELVPGDLVFYRIPVKKRHVGIYLGEGEFAHASYRKGVMISRTDSPHWKQYFIGARRVR